MLEKEFSTYLNVERRYSNHTVIAYEQEVHAFLQFLVTEGMTIQSVSYRDMRYYFTRMLEQGKIASSVNRAMSSLRTYFKFLQRRGCLTQNPMSLVKALKTPKNLPVVVETHKLVHLLDQMETELDSFASYRDHLILELLFGTGIRLAELLHIKEGDVDFYNKNVLILGKRSKERLVPINDTLLDAIKNYLQQKDLTFVDNKTAFLVVTNKGKPANEGLVRRVVKNYLARISTQSKRSPHVLRHTFATSLLDNGADLNAIKELLGHAGLAATQVYTHNSVERLKSIYKQAHPRA